MLRIIISRSCELLKSENVEQFARLCASKFTLRCDSTRLMYKNTKVIVILKNTALLILVCFDIDDPIEGGISFNGIPSRC